MTAMPLRLALFDFDGTLCDSDSIIIRTVQAAFSAHDLPPPIDAQIRSQIGTSLLSMLLPFVDGDVAKADAVSDTYRTLSNKNMDRQNSEVPPLFAGAKTALAELRDAGWLTAIITNKGRHGLDHAISNHELSPLIDASVTVDEMHAKPAPDMALSIMDRLGVEKQHTILVGDTVIDADCAHNAGIAFIGVEWGYHEAAELRGAGAIAILSSFAGLPEILAKGLVKDMPL